MRTLITAFLAFYPFADLTAAVLRVGPTRVHRTIQSAVNAAQSGDLVIVDSGTYAGFSIVGKAISIVPAGTSFTVTVPAGAPGILVRGLVYPAQVTLVGARIDYASASQPAVRLQNNTGTVRISQLAINLAADLCGAAQAGAFVVEGTRSFWLIDSRISTASARKASALTPLGSNDGVSGMFVRDSDGIVQNSQVRGYDACRDYAGDAVRMTGDTSLWILDDLAASPQPSVFQGGDGGKFGGNALHYLGAGSGLSRISQCGSARHQGGSGSVRSGGPLALNNDGAQPQPGLTRLPPVCLGQFLLQTSVDAPLARLGGSIGLRVFSVVDRSYMVFASINSRYQRDLLGLRLPGRGMLDVGAPLTSLVATGRNLAFGSRVHSVAVPGMSVLSGVQLTFQGVHGGSASALDALGFPSMVVITP